MSAPDRLTEAAWCGRRAAHEGRVAAWIGPVLARARRAEKHPVEDFLFTYYSHRPAQLRRWHPGAGVLLQGPEALPRLEWPHYGQASAPGVSSAACGVGVDVDGLVRRRGDALRHVQRLLAATASRPPHLGCFGLHEW